MQFGEKGVLPSPSDPSTSLSLPPVHYSGKSTLSKVFRALILALAYRYEVMSQLLRACMPCYCRHCGVILHLWPNTPSAPCPSDPKSNIQYNKHVFVFPKYTDHDFARVGRINEIEGRGELIAKMCHRQYLSCIERRLTCARFRLLFMLFMIYILCVCLSYYKCYAHNIKNSPY